MSKHTPGPWEAIPFDEDGEQHFGIINARQPCGGKIKTADIARIWPRGGKAKTAANASLIAAAPELLEALKFILADYEDAREEWNSFDAETYADHLIAEARAAIAKAEGTA